MNQEIIRPTKKQNQLLAFIEDFINTHGYSPSYREIMTGLNYTSVATVALHVNSLISRGHLKKRGNSARSLELVNPSATQGKVAIKQLNEAEEKWLIEKVEYYFKELEASNNLSESEVDKLYVLVGALKVLNLEGAANSFMPRLSDLRSKLNDKAGAGYG